MEIGFLGASLHTEYYYSLSALILFVVLFFCSQAIRLKGVCSFKMFAERYPPGAKNPGG